ncbi:MAG: hypothetical protein ACKVQA_25785 [Burkholderiales bacterium]
MSDEDDAVREAIANYWPLTRKRAEDGDASAALDLIDAALGALECDYPMDKDVKAFLVRVLKEIKRGIPPKDALMLAKAPHRPPDENLERNVSLAAAVVLQLRENPGLLPIDAYNKVAQMIGARWGLSENSDRTIERAYKEFRAAFEKNETDFLHQIAFKTPSNS